MPRSHVRDRPGRRRRPGRMARWSDRGHDATRPGPFGAGRSDPVPSRGYSSCPPYRRSISAMRSTSASGAATSRMMAPSSPLRVVARRRSPPGHWPGSCRAARSWRCDPPLRRAWRRGAGNGAGAFWASAGSSSPQGVETRRSRHGSLHPAVHLHRLARRRFEPHHRPQPPAQPRSRSSTLQEAVHPGAAARGSPAGGAAHGRPLPRSRGGGGPGCGGEDPPRGFRASWRLAAMPRAFLMPSRSPCPSQAGTR